MCVYDDSDLEKTTTRRLSDNTSGGRGLTVHYLDSFLILESFYVACKARARHVHLVTVKENLCPPSGNSDARGSRDPKLGW